MLDIVSILIFVLSKQRSNNATLKIQKLALMKKTFKVKKLKTIATGDFTTGNLVSSNDYRSVSYWKGNDEIRQGREKTYVILAGSTTVNGSACFAQHVYEVIEVPDDLNIEGMNAVWNDDYELQSVGGIGNIIFSDNFEELPHY